MIAQLDAALPGDGKFAVGTDATTKASKVPATGWLDAGFDDSAWAVASVLGPASMPPWNIGFRGGTTVALAQTQTLDRSITAPVPADQQLPHFVVAADTPAIDHDHLRYELASLMARNLDRPTLHRLLNSESDAARQLGELVIDIAAYEKLSGYELALEELRDRLLTAPADDLATLLELVRMHGSNQMVPVLAKLARRPDLPAAFTGQAILAIRGFADVPPQVLADVGTRFLEAVKTGGVALKSTADWLLLFDLLEQSDAADPEAIRLVGSQLDSRDGSVRERAHGLARGFGPNAVVADQVAKLALQGNAKKLAAIAGRAVFARVGCVKCHTTVLANALRAPSLKGIGQAQKPPYLVESILEPSAILKTGFETERIDMTNGRVLTGLVRDEGESLRVITTDDEKVVRKGDIEARTVMKLSIMPEGQERLMSAAELADLVEYLISLR